MWFPTSHRLCGPQAWPGAPRWLCLSSPRVGNRRNTVDENSQETGPGFPPSVQGLVYKFIYCAKPNFRKRSLFAGASGQESSCLENSEGSKINISFMSRRAQAGVARCTGEDVHRCVQQCYRAFAHLQYLLWLRSNRKKLSFIAHCIILCLIFPYTI